MDIRNRAGDLDFYVIEQKDVPATTKTLSDAMHQSIQEFKKTRSAESQSKSRCVILKAVNYSTSPTTMKLKLAIETRAGTNSESVDYEISGITLAAQSTSHLVVMELPGLDYARISIHDLSNSPKPENNCYYSMLSPFVVDVQMLENSYNGFRSEDELIAYVLLKNYEESSLPARKLMLDYMFKALDEALKGKNIVDGSLIETESQQKLVSLIQIDIISRLMMSIEDFIAILEGIRTANGNYYKLLDTEQAGEPDLGDKINEFFGDLPCMKNEEFMRLLCYPNMKQVSSDVDDQAVAGKLIDSNIEAIKQLLQDIKKFRDAHKQVFRRYKHAGFPFRPAIIGRAPYKESSKIFDSYSLILFGKHPLKDVMYLPYSNEIITAYRLFSRILHLRIWEVVRNKIMCLERHVDVFVPYENYHTSSFTNEELLKLSELSKQYNDRFPEHARVMDVEMPEANISVEERLWYIEVDEFLRKYSREDEGTVPVSS